MRLRNLLFAVVFTLALAITAHAEKPPRLSSTFKGSFNVTSREVQNHRFGLPTLIMTANNRTDDFVDVQNGWFDKCGMGLIYGYVSPYSKMTEQQRQDYVKANAKCETPPTTKDIFVTSCEYFVNRYLKIGFQEIGQSSVYSRINQFLNDNDRDGLALVYALRKLGWKVVYWNVDANTVPPLPEDRKVIGQNPADHAWSTKHAINKKEYYGVPVDALMLNFSPLKNSPTKRDSSAFAKLSNVPYYVGISHAGFHVWQGSYGDVTESHSFFDPADHRNIERGLFNPPYESPTGLEVDYKGAKQTFYYYSGIIAIPPGSWVWF